MEMMSKGKENMIGRGTHREQEEKMLHVWQLQVFSKASLQGQGGTGER